MSWLDSFSIVGFVMVIVPEHRSKFNPVRLFVEITFFSVTPFVCQNAAPALYLLFVNVEFEIDTFEALFAAKPSAARYWPSSLTFEKESWLPFRSSIVEVSCGGLYPEPGTPVIFTFVTVADEPREILRPL